MLDEMCDPWTEGTEDQAERPSPASATPAVPRRNRMDRALRRVIGHGGLVLHYQPRFCLAQGRMTGAEALVRWPDRRRGLILPDEFIPLAERSDAIHALGRWVLHAACAEAARWGGIGVTVNVSPRQLLEGALLHDVGEALAGSGLPAEMLELDLTEAALLGCEPDTLLALSALRDVGVRLALDDFGVGAASLAMLKRLPLTALKIDRLLVRELPESHEDAAIADAAVRTGHALGLTVVAEGIETEPQRALLAGLGCDEGQGYLFGRPAPATSLREFLPA